MAILRHNNDVVHLIANEVTCHLLCISFYFQIRQEKPYYVPNPELDSLVSVTITSLKLRRAHFTYSRVHADRPLVDESKYQQHYQICKTS